MENTQKTHEENVQRIADNLDKQQEVQQTKGLIAFIMLPVWIYIIYQVIS
jgi:hypothetical protein